MRAPSSSSWLSLLLLLLPLPPRTGQTDAPPWQAGFLLPTKEPVLGGGVTGKEKFENAAQANGRDAWT